MNSARTRPTCSKKRARILTHAHTVIQRLASINTYYEFSFYYKKIIAIKWRTDTDVRVFLEFSDYKQDLLMNHKNKYFLY